MALITLPAAILYVPGPDKVHQGDDRLHARGPHGLSQLAVMLEVLLRESAGLRLDPRP